MRESYIAIRQEKARLVAAYSLSVECFARAWSEMSFPERQRYLADPQSKTACETLQNAEFKSLLKGLR